MPAWSISAAVGPPPPLGPSLASWQTVGGCGAGASTGNAAGVKWIGRSVTGGLFGVQCQVTYTRAGGPEAERPEHHAFVNTLITSPVTDRWIMGVNVPLVLKYMVNPFQNGADLSNTGLGDISLQLTRKLGPIGATALTLAVGLPTGQHDGEYRTKHPEPDPAARLRQADRVADAGPHRRRDLGADGGRARPPSGAAARTT